MSVNEKNDILGNQKAEMPKKKANAKNIIIFIMSVICIGLLIYAGTAESRSRQQGYAEGHNEGYSAGFEEGTNKGRELGFDQGYKAGYGDGEEHMASYYRNNEEYSDYNHVATAAEESEWAREVLESDGYNFDD